MPRLLNLMKEAGVEAVENTAPCIVLFGKVIQLKPLKIRVEQRLILGEKQLIKTNNSKAIKKGESVVLLRMQGGQKFIILDSVTD